MVFGKVKKWLGIEGVKMEIVLPDDLILNDGIVKGKIKFTTMNTQQILGTKIKLYERYTRGRRKSKISDEYLLGEVILAESFMVYPEDEKYIEFELSFKLVKSEMDKVQEKGGFMGGLAAIAKKSRGIKSNYRVEAEADVSGTPLNPFDKKEIAWKR